MKKLVFLVALILVPSLAFAATRTASVDGLWTATATWGGSAEPTNADDCTINSGIDVVMDNSAGVCGSLTVNGNLIFKEGARSLTIGDGLAAGTSDNVTVGSAGSIQFGAGQSFLINTANTTGAANRGKITINGYVSAVGRTLFDKGRVDTVGEVSGNWPDRLVVLRDYGLRQTSVDQYVGKVLIPTSGYFRWAWFDIVAGGTTKNDIAVRIDGQASSATHRGQVDSRNVAGRVDPRTTGWAPGDWGEIIDGGTNGWPAKITVESGSTTVDFSAAVPGTTSRLSDLIGARIICGADLDTAGDTDFRIIESVTDSDTIVLKSAYGTTSCNAAATGGDYAILQDNQPPVKTTIQEAFGYGDTYMIIDPATFGIPSASWSDSTQGAQMALVANSGSTVVMKDASIGNCGYEISGGTETPCFTATQIDNTNTNEGLYLDNVEWHHYNGTAALDLEDCANITFRRLSIRDAADGANATTVSAGTCPGAEAHGIRINDTSANTERVTGLKFIDLRVIRTNDVPFSPFTAEDSDEVNCSDCSLTNAFLGFAPNSCGNSTQCVGLSEGVTNFKGDSIFCTNAPSGGYAGTNVGTGTNSISGYIANSLFLNLTNGGFAVGSLTDASGTTDANTNFYLTGNVWQDVYVQTGGNIFTRGIFYSNYVEPANKGIAVLWREPQKVYGNVVVLPPNMVSSGGGTFDHEPTGTARIEPTTLYEWDNVIYGPTAYTATSDSIFMGGKSGSSGLSSNFDVQHNTLIGTQHLLTSGAAEGWRWRGVASDTYNASNNIFINMDYTHARVSGAEVVTDDYNLCIKLRSTGCPDSITAGANTLTTGIPGLFSAASLDFNLTYGSTAYESLGSDGYPRGARVSGPPDYSRFKRLYPWFTIPAAVVNNIADVDADGDGVWNIHDNCDLTFNPSQYDGDADGKGCACDASGDTCP